MKKKGVKKISVLVLIIALLMTSVMMIPAMGVSAATADTTTYQGRFMDMYNKIHDASNGYFSAQGIPYHTIETLICEAPDYGHETTSEAMSYYVWLEAMYGKFTGDFAPFQKSWDTIETYMIPTAQDQPGMSKYNATKPATYAGEYELPDNYPSALDFNAPVGSDPINSQLASAYGTYEMYGMHWILDVDNWYGFGVRGDGVGKPAYMNTFQRGEQESCFETIPQPCWDAMKSGGTNGYLDLFVKDQQYAKQFKYTDAPDADARAIQATYWASVWAKDQGKTIGTYAGKAAKMGDYLRYAFFDKYFRKIGSSTQGGTGYDSCHYLLSWYYAWGGGLDGAWAWKIGSSHNHGGYQNPMTAWVLSTQADFKPKSSNGAKDWDTSLGRQLEFYQWLQSAEGAIGGGASNSWNGRYEAIPSDVSTFYGMGYQQNPVYHDPGSNTWFGFQTWSMQRVMQYYYQTKDPRAKDLVTKWAKWAISEVKFENGTFAIPSSIDWQGQPDTWKGTYTGNPNLHVTVTSYGTDLGVAGNLCNSLLYYSAATGDNSGKDTAKKILDLMWKNYRDSKGIAAPETRGDFKRMFEQTVYVPAGWTGKMPNGDVIKSGVKFIDIRSKYKQDPAYPAFKAAYDAKQDPTFTFHRFWGESDITLALGTMAILFPNEKPDNGPVTSPTPTTPVTSPVPTTTPVTSSEPYTGENVFVVNTTFSATRLVANQMFTAKVTATNAAPQPYEGKQDVLLIVALYDANNTMQNVSYISKGIGYLGTETLSAGFKLPSNVSGYSVRAFMWDGTDMKDTMMIPLSNVTQLP